MDDAFQREGEDFEWLVTVVSIANDDLRIDNARVCGRQELFQSFHKQVTICSTIDAVESHGLRQSIS